VVVLDGIEEFEALDDTDGVEELLENVIERMSSVRSRSWSASEKVRFLA